MSKSKVFYTNLRVKVGDTLQMKLERLLRKSGLPTMDLDGKYVAVKIHFGEPGNLAFLRPNYARTVVDMITHLGGKPFLTDCNTLYVGGRKNALDHLESAYQNGFNPYNTGCHILIADGLKGTDEVYVPVEGGEYIKEAKIGRAVMDADVFISVNHFKGHELAGFGGALKNIGMGCGSRAGKMEMHSAGKPYVNQDLCIGCGQCAKNCAHGAPIITDQKAAIDLDKCVGCGRCIGVCPKDAVKSAQDEANEVLNYKIAEYTKAVLDHRPHFHISFIMDVSPYCDCHADNDLPVVPDIGIFASFDPVALDMACADAVNAQTPTKGSILEESNRPFPDDHFASIFPETNWKCCITHAQKLGLGTEEYELIEVK
ncbi:MAG: DUF362 domain-containing protein [Lachnospiraceae bacterium]|jgi:uncharacterized Fe-S center protein|nr:DUF362 domain-containing protein [Lachnospiraceae bacterium]